MTMLIAMMIMAKNVLKITSYIMMMMTTTIQCHIIEASHISNHSIFEGLHMYSQFCLWTEYLNASQPVLSLFYTKVS